DVHGELLVVRDIDSSDNGVNHVVDIYIVACSRAIAVHRDGKAFRVPLQQGRDETLTSLHDLSWSVRVRDAQDDVLEVIQVRVESDEVLHHKFRDAVRRYGVRWVGLRDRAVPRDWSIDRTSR